MKQNELTETEKRKAVIAHCLKMNRSGLNQGTSGNISIRHGDGMLITPTSTPYEDLIPESIAYVHMDGSADGPLAPSSEWRFHRDILAVRDDVDAIVHAHPTYCTILAIHGRGIPAIHYMIAVFGGPDIRVAPYAIYGSQALSDHAVRALEDRQACLLDHHGSIALGSTIEQAFWRGGTRDAGASVSWSPFPWRTTASNRATDQRCDQQDRRLWPDGRGLIDDAI